MFRRDGLREARQGWREDGWMYKEGWMEHCSAVIKKGQRGVGGCVDRADGKQFDKFSQLIG